MPKNVLVEYKGGGYDGCFWEYNYFLFDENGDFHNLLATGFRGIEDEYEALCLLNKDLEDLLYNKVFILDLSDDNKDEIVDFVDGNNASFMKHISDVILELELGYDLLGTCYDCGGIAYVHDMIPEDFAGDGHGIMYTGRNLYCGVCDLINEEAIAIEEMDTYYKELENGM